MRLRCALLPRTAVTLLAAFTLAGWGASSARADYWDYSGWLYPNPTYPFLWQEGAGPYNGVLYFRLSRSNCHPKMQIHTYSGTWYQVAIPGGCDNLDYTYPWGRPWSEDGARGINNDCCKGWANMRFAPDI